MCFDGIVTETDREHIMLIGTEYPHTAIRPISDNADLCKASLHQILKSEK